MLRWSIQHGCAILPKGNPTYIKITVSKRLFTDYTLRVHGNKTLDLNTVCPESSDPFYMVTSYIKWFTTSWTDSIMYLQYTYKQRYGLDATIHL